MLEMLYRPINNSSLILFRILGALFLTGEIVYGLAHGDFQEYTSPAFHFSYLFFEWVKPLSPFLMKILFGTTVLAGLFTAAGLFYRVSSALFFLGYTSLFLMEGSEYINHFYLYCLLSFWMMVLPLDRRFSLDGLLFGKKEQTTTSAWHLYLILFHTFVAYFFAGLAKLHPHWLDGTMMKLFLFGRYQGIPQWLPHVMAYAGLFFDLLIVPLILWRPTRWLAFITAVIFHLTNAYIFGLATFPWLMILLTTLFVFPVSQTQINLFPRRKWLEPILACYLLVHVTVPFRHLLYPGDASWTEEGHQFSWRMKTRIKRGQIAFHVVNPKTKETRQVKARDYLTEKQLKDMVGKPDMILQFAHFLKKKFGGEGVEVYASCMTSLNATYPREMIKPGTNLAEEKRHIGHYDWILPYESSPSVSHSDTSF